MKAFDRKFGPEFIREVPLSPGIYRVYDGEDRLIYVGKAKNLRRRLSQYRNAKRRKKHARMKAVVAGAVRIEIEPCLSEDQALLLENRWIQEKRPRLNIAGAFSFIYPFLGVRHDPSGTVLVMTSRPEAFPGFSFHGCFRSRALTREAFHALLSLLEFVGHRMPRQKLPGATERYAIRAGFRQLPQAWCQELESFWRGESLQAIESLVLCLVENAGARSRGRQVQQDLNRLRQFWKLECQPLARVRKSQDVSSYPVPQTERDAIFIRARHLAAASGATHSPSPGLLSE